MLLETAYGIIDLVIALFIQFKSLFATIVASGYPHGKFLNSVGFAMCASLRVRASFKNERPFWLYSLALILFTGYGGGIAAPIMMGRPIAIVANDALLFTSIFSWMLTNVFDLSWMFQWKPTLMILHFFMAVFRANAISNTLVTANTFLTPTPYYPTPLLGPVFLGTMSSSFGIFFPTDVGLKPIQNGVPWGFQAALMSSALYQLGVVDKTGFMGAIFRSVFGSYTDAEARIAITLLYVQGYWLQILFGREINIFAPVHKLLYAILPAQGPRVLNSNSQGALTPYSTKPDDAIVSVGGWSFQQLENFEFVVDCLRLAFVAVVAGFFLQSNRDEFSPK